MVRLFSLFSAALVVLALVATSARAQFGRGLQIPPVVQNIFLLRTEAVQKEIDLSADQNKSISDIALKMQSEAMEVLSGLQDLTEEERKEELPNLMKMLGEKGKELQAKVDKILNPKQTVRMKELSLQRRGAGALQDEEVIAALKLSDEQKKQLDEVRSAAGKQQEEIMKSLFGGGGGGVDQSAIRGKMEAVQKELGEKTVAILTSEQRERFEKMKGAKFDFPQGRGRGLPF
jgi:hypothetical protein